MDPKYQMFEDDYLYIVKVYDEGEVYEYEYGNPHHAMEDYTMEKAKGNKVELIRHNVVTGKTERFQEKPKCTCAKCNPKPIQYRPRQQTN